jgi:hypothetical protein
MLFCFAYTNAQISSTWIRLQVRLQNTRSWYEAGARPASTINLLTAFLLVPVTLVTARMELSSHSR